MSSEGISNDPIEKHIRVSGLIRNIVDDLEIRTLGDACSLDIKEVERIKGVGVKKISEFKHLIENARRLCGEVIDPHSFARVDLSGTIFESFMSLVFVPSILKLAFERLRIDSVEKLLTLDVDELESMPGWGDKKRSP